MLLLPCLYVERDSLTAAVSLYGRNVSSAFQWYLEAAQRGSATGQFLVGLAYSNGVAWRVGNLKFLVDLAWCGYQQLEELLSIPVSMFISIPVSLLGSGWNWEEYVRG